MLRLASDPLQRAEARRELELRKARQDLAAFMIYVFEWTIEDFQRSWLAAADRYDRLVVVAPIEHTKSSVFSLALPLFELGRNPNTRICLVSATSTQSNKFLAAIRGHITSNSRLHEVFPELRPAEGEQAKWTDSAINIARDAVLKDPSVIAIGTMSSLLGARIDLAVLDDSVSFECSWSRTQRQRLSEWFKGPLVSRIVADGRVVVVNTPWHPDDLLGELEKSGSYHTIKSPAINSDGSALWPAQWPLARLENRRREIGDSQFRRQFLVQAQSDASSRFSGEWIDSAYRAAEELKATLIHGYSGPGQTYTGCDLAVGQGNQHDESVLFTILALPDGRRQVLSIEAGKWQGPELVLRLKDTFQRYRSRIRVETNAAQEYIAQFVREAGVPVESHQTTARNKHDPKYGVESLAQEFAQGLWIVPSAPETHKWTTELLAYSPTGHTADRIMASWLARECLRERETSTPLGFLSSSQGLQTIPTARGVVVARPSVMPDETWDDHAGWGPLGFWQGDGLLGS